MGFFPVLEPERELMMVPTRQPLPVQVEIEEGSRKVFY